MLGFSRRKTREGARAADVGGEGDDRSHGKGGRLHEPCRAFTLFDPSVPFYSYDTHTTA